MMFLYDPSMKQKMLFTKKEEGLLLALSTGLLLFTALLNPFVSLALAVASIVGIAFYVVITRKGQE